MAHTHAHTHSTHTAHTSGTHTHTSKALPPRHYTTMKAPHNMLILQWRSTYCFVSFHQHILLCLVLYQPLDHTLCAINHVKDELTNIKWFNIASWPTSSCVLTFNSVYWQFLLILCSIWCIQHMLDYTIYGWGQDGGAFLMLPTKLQYMHLKYNSYSHCTPLETTM